MMIHCVWATKYRESLIKLDTIAPLIAHIKENAKEKGIYLDCINAVSDHIHCLISLGGTQNIAKVMELIKGESSYWYNKQGFGNKLYWQDDYFAVSIGQSQIEIVRRYILNQQNHHKKKTFQEEYKEFIASYGFSRDDWLKKGDKSP